MTAKAGLTAGLTPKLTLIAVNPIAKCAWCGCDMPDVREGQRYCSRSHRQMDYAARWQQAPKAIFEQLVGLTLRGLATLDEVPSIAHIADALECCGAKRRAQLMDALGLTWNEREWRRVDEKGNGYHG